jgi:hypothetical protein
MSEATRRDNQARSRFHSSLKNPASAGTASFNFGDAEMADFNSWRNGVAQSLDNIGKSMVNSSRVGFVFGLAIMVEPTPTGELIMFGSTAWGGAGAVFSMAADGLKGDWKKLMVDTAVSGAMQRVFPLTGSFNNAIRFHSTEVLNQVNDGAQKGFK